MEVATPTEPPTDLPFSNLLNQPTRTMWLKQSGQVVIQPASIW